MSTRAERNDVLEELQKELQDARGIFVADNNKITVAKITKLRAELRKKDVKFIVVKNTLAREACTRLGKSELGEFFKGPTALAVSQKDGTAPAKIIRDFQKENNDLLGLRIAYVDGSVFKGQDALKLADLPSREVLLAQLLGCLQAPIGNFAGVLNGIMSKFVRTLDAVKDKKASV